MKKVLFSATVDSHILQFHLPFLKLFKEKGYEVHVATNGTEEIPYCDVKHVVSFERSPFKVNNLKAIKQLRKIIDNEKFDITHTHTPMGSVVTRLAAKKARKNFHTRVIYTAHGFHFFKGAPLINWCLFYPVEKYLAKYTDTLITINQEDFDRAKRKFSKRCHDIEYVPGVGIDESKFDFKMTEKEKEEYRKSLGLKKSDFVMIFPAELNKNKNQKMLIEAMKDLVVNNPQLKLLLPGRDSYNGYYQQLVKDYKLEKNVLFLGYRKDIPKLLKISNIAVASSYREGLPLNIMEAMYVGLPIIATDVRGQRDLVEDGKNGFIISVNDTEALKERILLLNKEQQLMKSMQKSNNLKVKDYLIDNISDKLQKIYFRKKKILYLLSSNKFSGAESVICTIMSKMKSNYNVVYCSPKGEIEQVLQKKGLDYYGLNKLNIKNLRNAIKEEKPDIIHANDFKASLISSFFYKKAIIISHIHKNDPKMKKKTLKSIIYTIRSKKYNRIIGVSDSVIKEFYKPEIIKNKYITLFNYVNKNEILEKAKQDPSQKKYNLFYLGRFSEEKNPMLFIEIIKELKIKYPSIKGIMIGDGPLKDICKEKINNYNLKENVYLVGYQNNPFKLIKNAGVGIIPSTFEGFGLSAIECMILNKPLLNSGVGGLHYIFKNNKDMICKDLNEYLRKYEDFKGKKIKYDINEFTDEKLFTTKLIKIYEGEV